MADFPGFSLSVNGPDAFRQDVLCGSETLSLSVVFLRMGCVAQPQYRVGAVSFCPPKSCYEIAAVLPLMVGRRNPAFPSAGSRAPGRQGGRVPWPSLPGMPPGRSAEPAGRVMPVQGAGDLFLGAAMNKVTADPGRADSGGDRAFPGLALGPRPFVRDWLASRALWSRPGPHGPDGQEAPCGPSVGLPFLPDINIPGPAPCERPEAPRGEPGGTRTQVICSPRADSWPLQSFPRLPPALPCFSSVVRGTEGGTVPPPRSPARGWGDREAVTGVSVSRVLCIRA